MWKQTRSQECAQHMPRQVKFALGKLTLHQPLAIVS